MAEQLQSTHSFAELRSVWKDPEWLSFEHSALVHAPTHTYLVFDDNSLSETNLEMLKALTHPSLGNVIIICELCIDLLDLHRKDQSKHQETFMEDRQYRQSAMRVSTMVRSLLTDSEDANIRLQSVEQYDMELIRSEGVEPHDSSCYQLFVSCAKYFATSRERKVDKVKNTLIVTTSKKIKDCADRYGIPTCAYHNLLSYKQ